ncbi:MAG: hypothetical protein EXR02_04415 [Rhodospirillales bacterium]|nr:hypothetical protein [Rhodospirillales bacterium]MSP80298.1 hypothetical protein [Rhodospirillales bacterium]
MFGLSLTKILLTIFVILAVWYGWRFFTRFLALKALRERAGDMPKPSARAPAGAQGQGEAEDMLECRTCGAFIAASRRVACGRKDCPFP